MNPAELARRLNEHVYDAATASSPVDGPALFRCQCGCGEPVWRTIAQFDAAGGAWKRTHKPATARARAKSL